MKDAVDYSLILIVQHLVMLDSSEVGRLVANPMHLPERGVIRRKQFMFFLLNLL